MTLESIFMDSIPTRKRIGISCMRKLPNSSGTMDGLTDKFLIDFQDFFRLSARANLRGPQVSNNDGDGTYVSRLH